MLYLENRQMADVFNMDRVEILKHLSSQFGVSVQNALLFDSLTRKVRELKESEERFALAVAGSSAGIWDWAIDTNKVHYSDRFKELLGYTPDEFSDEPDEFWNRLHPDDRESTRMALEQHIEKHEPYTIDYRLQVRSGEYRWFHGRGQALWDKAGEATRMSGSLTDITERKQAEKALRDSRGKLIKAEQIARMGFLDWDLKTNDIVWSSEVYKLYGVGPETPVTIELTTGLVHPDDRGLVSSNLEMAIQGTGEYDIDHRIIRPDGEVIWVHARADLVRDGDGKPTSLIGTVVDITERTKAEEETRGHRDALARVVRTTSMGLLTGSIAHELNQPLTGILANAQAAELMIRSGQPDSNELAQIMADIVEDTKRGGEVIHNLRELYRGQPSESAPVDINAVIDETINLLHGEFVKKQVVITTACDPGIPAVMGNRVQIQQVLVNLIMNSVEAMDAVERSGRSLYIMTAHETNVVKTWVEDRGPGIDADKIDHIFEPLATWKPGGTGMGLAISDSIIRAHGGKMTAENRPAGGARVGFELLTHDGDQEK